MGSKQFPISRGMLLEALLLAFLFALSLYPSWSQAWLLTFQTRDVLRAQELLRGQLIFFGPEITGGGHLPGGLYYYLLAIPLALGLGWKGGWALIVAFQALTASLLWIFFRRLTGGLLVPLFAVLCFGSAFAIHVSSLFLLNSALLFLPAAAVLAGLCVAYSPAVELRWRRRALAAVMLAFALGVQLHLSLLALFPALLILQLLGARMGLARLAWGHFFRSFLFLFPLLPFALWLAARAAGLLLGQQPPAFAVVNGIGNYLAHSYGNFTMLHWEAHRYIGGFWYAVGKMLLQLHHYVTDAGALAFVCYLVSAAWIARFGARLPLRRPAPAGEATATILFVCAGCAFVPGIASMGVGGTGVRYLGVTSLAWIFFSAAALERALAHPRLRETFEGWLAPRWARGAGSALLGVFSLIYLAHFGARSERFPREFAQDVAFASFAPAGELESAARFIVSQTGWPYSTFRERAFLVNIFNEITIQTNYEEVEREIQPAARTPGGYFVARRPSGKDVEESEKDLASWLVSQRIPANIAEGLKNGGIRLGSLKSFGTLLVVPYEVVSPDLYPAYFQNRSEHYQSMQDAKIEAALKEQESEPGRTRVAEFNHCPDRNRYCRLALVARSRDLRDSRYPLTVEILGIPLSHSTQHFNPAWSEVILGPYLSYQCEGSKERRKEVLAPVAGMYIVDNFLLNHSVLAPYRRELRPRCDGKGLAGLSLGFGSATAISYLREIAIPGEERALF